MRHLLTLAEMTSYLNSRNDISTAVKAKILSGDSCTSLKGDYFAVETYAKARWADTPFKNGLPGASPFPISPPSAPAHSSKNKALPEPRFTCNGATLSVSQIRKKLASDDLDSEDIVVRVGGDGEEFRIREVDELIRSSPVAAPRQLANVLAPAPSPQAVRSLPRSRIAAASMRAYCAELERPEAADDSSDSQHEAREQSNERRSAPAPATRSSQIIAKANAAAQRAASQPDDGPEAA